MLYELIDHLTDDQRATLREHYSITRQLLCNWRKHRSHPTLMQTIDLADVTGVPYQQLQAEIAYLKAPADQRERVARVVGFAATNRS